MSNFQHDIDEALTVLRAGGTILYPTDTIWGIGCDATKPAAVEKVYALKNRPDHKALIILLADERDLLRYVAAPDLSIFDYLDQQPRPVTVIYDHAIGLAENLTGPDGSIGIRICKDPFCKTLIKRFRKPIVSTSANFSGQPSPASFADLSPELLQRADYVVTHRQQERVPAAASSIIKWENGAPIIIRP